MAECMRLLHSLPQSCEPWRVLPSFSLTFSFFLVTDPLVATTSRDFAPLRPDCELSLNSSVIAIFACCSQHQNRRTHQADIPVTRSDESDNCTKRRGLCPKDMKSGVAFT
jgi:hypothetical protein